MATEAEHLAAVKALLNTAGARPHTAQDLADLDSPPTYYTEVTVTQRMGTGPRRSRQAQSTQWRIRCLTVGERYGNAQLMRARVEALHEATVTVGGEVFYIERADVEHDPIGPDDGWWSGTSEFIY